LINSHFLIQAMSEVPTVHAVPASLIQSNVPKSTILKKNAKAKKGVSYIKKFFH